MILHIGDTTFIKYGFQFFAGIVRNHCSGNLVKTNCSSWLRLKVFRWHLADITNKLQKVIKDILTIICPSFALPAQITIHSAFGFVLCHSFYQHIGSIITRRKTVSVYGKTAYKLEEPVRKSVTDGVKFFLTELYQSSFCFLDVINRAKFSSACAEDASSTKGTNSFFSTLFHSLNDVFQVIFIVERFKTSTVAGWSKIVLVISDSFFFYNVCKKFLQPLLIICLVNRIRNKLSGSLTINRFLHAIIQKRSCRRKHLVNITKTNIIRCEYRVLFIRDIFFCPWFNCPQHIKIQRISHRFL